MTDYNEDTSRLETALAVTSAITEFGYALLPGQPTAEMLAAGSKAGDLTLEQAYKIYTAMHQAAIKELGLTAHDPLALLQRLQAGKGH